MSAMAKFRVELVAGAAPAVYIDDKRVDGVVAAVVEGVPGQLPRVTIELQGEGVVEGEAIVERGSVITSPDVREAIVEFLGGLDPTQISKAATSRMDWGDNDLVTSVIAVIAEQVRP